jgi:hypothetical protein
MTRLYAKQGYAGGLPAIYAVDRAMCDPNVPSDLQIRNVVLHIFDVLSESQQDRVLSALGWERVKPSSGGSAE